MSWLHPALLFGLLLSAVPIALHLLLRARPKRQVFPALRLLQQRRMQNQRRMRLRHLWLLLLRMALIAVLVLAIARPSLPAANYQPTTWEILGLATILALAAAAYFVTMTVWSRQRQPQHQFATRRTYLRGGVGLTAVLLSLLLIGWPYQRRIAAELTSPLPRMTEDLPVAAVFLCDTSLSMTYRFEGQSRLDAARQIAINHLQRLPASSQAAVLDATGELPAVLTPDLAAVQNRLEGLSPRAAGMALNDQIRSAMRFLTDERRRLQGEQANVPEDRRQDRFLREIYVFTDLARAAWRADEAQSLAEELKDLDWLGIYLIDVGIEQPTNLGIVDPRVSRQTIGAGGMVFVEAMVRATGDTAKSTVVELWQSTDNAAAAKRDQQTVSFEQEQSAAVRFLLENLNGTLIQGSLKLVASDPLAIDDEVHFSVNVLPPLNVLTVAPDRSTAQFWLEALGALSELGTTQRPRYVASERLADVDLQDVDVVCLINVAQPSVREWERLTAFVEAGGGLLVCLGASSSTASTARRGIDQPAYDSPAALGLLPVRPKASLQFSTPQQLNFRETPHPIRQRLEAFGVLTELSDVDFRRYWSVDVLPESMVLANWTGDAGLPALVLRERGRGRVAVFTSSIDSIAWSDWPRNWTYVVTVDQWLQLLSRQASTRHNFLTGDPVVLPVDPDTITGPVLVRHPDLTQRRVEVSPTTRDITVMDARSAGNYQIVASAPQPRLLSGFSVNISASESNLTRLTTEDLDQRLGAGRYGLARDPEQLEKSVLAGRFGQEVSGLLLTLLTLVFVIEQATATWFYRQDEATPQ